MTCWGPIGPKREHLPAATPEQKEIVAGTIRQFEDIAAELEDVKETALNIIGVYYRYTEEEDDETLDRVDRLALEEETRLAGLDTETDVPLYDEVMRRARRAMEDDD